MRAATYDTYGAPDVLRVREVPTPTAGDGEILVQVQASTVTQGDRRLRSADFPGISWLPGRLMVGLFRPKARVLGTMFAGRVAAVGKGVTRFVPGDDVFGSCMSGAYGEYVAVPADGTVAQMPAAMGYGEAAALPYGAMTALIYLRDLGRVERGQRVLVIGASGGVGRYAVQVAAHFGAEVTGVCGSDHELVRSLGAAHVVDHRREDFSAGGREYDIIFDASDTSSFGRCKASLTPRGRFLSLYMTATVLVQMLVTSLFGGRRAMVGAAFGSRADMEQVRDLAEQGAIWPVIDGSYPLERIVEAHARVETDRPHGSVVVTFSSHESRLREVGAEAGERRRA